MDKEIKWFQDSVYGDSEYKEDKNDKKTVYQQGTAFNTRNLQEPEQ